MLSVFTVGVYAAIILLSDTNTLYNKFANAKLDLILIALGLFSTGYFLRSFRWIAMIRCMKIKIPILKNIIIYFTGYAFSLTPGKIGEGVRSKYLKDDFQVPITKSFPTVLSERYYDVIGVLAIIFVTSGLDTQNFIIYLSIALIVFFYFAVKKKNAEKLLLPLSKIKRISGLCNGLIELIDTLEILLKPKIFFQVTILTIFSWAFEAIGAYFVFQSFGIDLGVLKASFLYVTTSFIGAASFLPGGVGGTEGSLLGLLLLEGFEYSDILGSVLVIRFFALWYVIMIGIAFTFIYKLNQRRAERIG